MRGASSVRAAGLTTQWSMRLRRLLVFLGLVMANCASSGRSHQTVMAREVPDGTPTIAPFMQPFASAGIAVMAMTSANAVLPRIALIKKLVPCHSNPCTAHRFLDHPASSHQLRRQLVDSGEQPCCGFLAAFVATNSARCLRSVPDRVRCQGLMCHPPGTGCRQTTNLEERLVARLAAPLEDEKAA